MPGFFISLCVFDDRARHGEAVAFRGKRLLLKVMLIWDCGWDHVNNDNFLEG
jgi:hypothetical protein